MSKNRPGRQRRLENKRIAFWKQRELARNEGNSSRETELSRMLTKIDAQLDEMESRSLLRRTGVAFELHKIPRIPDFSDLSVAEGFELPSLRVAQGKTPRWALGKKR